MDDTEDQLEDLMIRALKASGDPLDDEQIMEFVYCKMKNDEYVFAYDRIDYFYDCVGMVHKYGFEKTLEYLRGIEEWDPDVQFTNPEYTLHALNERDKSIRKGRIKPVLKSFRKCKNCGSDNIMDYEKQTRRADEEMTIMFYCACCGQRVR